MTAFETGKTLKDLTADIVQLQMIKSGRRKQHE